MEKNRIYALVVDDSDINTMILSNMLGLFNIDVDIADSGMKALELVNDKEYDIIFLDHIMPVLDGVQTTRVIRERYMQDRHVIVIIALTSSITDEIRWQYQSAGANGVYIKPLGLAELMNILKHWCPQLSEQEFSVQEIAVHYEDKESPIKPLIYDISEMNYEVGLRYALGDPNNYINILKVSLKDIRTFINMVQLGYDNKQWKDMRIGVHNMKSVFANIGAIEMVEKAKELEQVILQENWIEFDKIICGRRFNCFYDKLKSAIETYDRICNELTKEELPHLLMSLEENEQSLTRVIYYIKRFDYAAILDELELLIKRGRPEYRKALEQALVSIKDFQYENALLLLTDIKKEMEQGAISADIDYL